MVQGSSHFHRDNQYTRDNAKSCRDPIHRSDTPAESVSDYQKRRITVPLLDHLMCELDYRSDISKTQAICKINSNSSPTREKSLERKVFISWNFYWR